jgi:hypothetical protein
MTQQPPKQYNEKLRKAVEFFRSIHKSQKQVDHATYQKWVLRFCDMVEDEYLAAEIKQTMF